MINKITNKYYHSVFQKATHLILKQHSKFKNMVYVNNIILNVAYLYMFTKVYLSNHHRKQKSALNNSWCTVNLNNNSEVPDLLNSYLFTTDYIV